MKYYSMIIYTQDGEEAARFAKLRAPELMRKVDAAIELGAYAVVDAAGEKEEQPKYIKMLDPGIDIQEPKIYDHSKSVLENIRDGNAITRKI